MQAQPVSLGKIESTLIEVICDASLFIWDKFVKILLNETDCVTKVKIRRKNGIHSLFTPKVWHAFHHRRLTNEHHMV